MVQMNPYLHFDGKTREAMEFYKKSIGGELQIMTVGESPAAKDNPKMKDKVMHAVLKKDGYSIMASDMMSNEGIKKGNNMSVTLICTSKDEIKELFTELSKGGKVLHELKDEFFGTYGDFVDKFGVDWMMQYSENPM
jgi:PhnB protein